MRAVEKIPAGISKGSSALGSKVTVSQNRITLASRTEIQTSSLHCANSIGSTAGHGSCTRRGRPHLRYRTQRWRRQKATSAQPKKTSPNSRRRRPVSEAGAIRIVEPQQARSGTNGRCPRPAQPDTEPVGRGGSVRGLGWAPPAPTPIAPPLRAPRRPPKRRTLHPCPICRWQTACILAKGACGCSCPEPS